MHNANNANDQHVRPRPSLRPCSSKHYTFPNSWATRCEKATVDQEAPVYDGLIYFSDPLPQYASNWQDRFQAEIDMGLEAGHRQRSA
jgi:hypothetical protein